MLRYVFDGRHWHWGQSSRNILHVFFMIFHVRGLTSVLYSSWLALCSVDVVMCLRRKAIFSRLQFLQYCESTIHIDCYEKHDICVLCLFNFLKFKWQPLYAHADDHQLISVAMYLISWSLKSIFSIVASYIIWHSHKCSWEKVAASN